MVASVPVSGGRGHKGSVSRSRPWQVPVEPQNWQFSFARLDSATALFQILRGGLFVLVFSVVPFQNSFEITGPAADFNCRMYYFLLYTRLLLSRAGVGLMARLPALRPDRLPLISARPTTAPLVVSVALKTSLALPTRVRRCFWSG